MSVFVVHPLAVVHLNITLCAVSFVANYTLHVHSLSVQYKEWNEHDQMLLGYIETRSKPHILYLPKEHIPKTEELVSRTRQKVEGESPFTVGNGYM